MTSVNISHFFQAKSFRIGTTLMLAALMVVAAANTVATAQTYTDLYNFHGRHDNAPSGVLAQGRDGNLYGTTYYGGTFGHGVVFRVTPAANLRLYTRSMGCTVRIRWAD